MAPRYRGSILSSSSRAAPYPILRTSTPFFGARMLNAFKSLDRILRGETTSLPSFAPAIRRPHLGLCLVIDVLGLVYGACMGVFALTGGNHAPMQIVATMLKSPPSSC